MGCGVMFGGKCGTATIMEGFWKGIFEMWLETGFLRRISCLSQECRGGIGLSMLQQLGTGSMEWWRREVSHNTVLVHHDQNFGLRIN
jgi:hypothetical protein